MVWGSREPETVLEREVHRELVRRLTTPWTTRTLRIAGSPGIPLRAATEVTMEQTADGWTCAALAVDASPAAAMADLIAKLWREVCNVGESASLDTDDMERARIWSTAIDLVGPGEGAADSRWVAYLLNLLQQAGDLSRSAP